MFIVLSVNTGDFEFYAEKLEHYIQGIVTYSPLYAATEGLLGININPSSNKYILIPHVAYCEFIPIQVCYFLLFFSYFFSLLFFLYYFSISLLFFNFFFLYISLTFYTLK